MLKFFRLPFATTGDKTAVPDAVDVNGNVSYSQGYGFDYQRQKTDPASKNIERDKMNQVFFDITTAIAEIQAQGVPDFITSALNGGIAYSYGINALVHYAGDVYQSLVAANVALPSDATKWALLPTAARLQSAYFTSCVAGGTADALTGAFALDPLAYPAAPATQKWLVRAGAANATATPTFTPNSGTLAAKTIVKGSNLALVAGDIAGAGHWLELVYDATLDKIVLNNPATGGAAPLSIPQIQSVSASVVGNALTLGYAGGKLDFRNAALTNGAPVAGVTIGALSLVVPQGATLGMIGGVAARLIWGVAYNAGVPVLCVANQAGGFNFDETTLVSPTTISAAANSASVVYSASAVGANSPFRVVGFLDITEAVAGTYATAPTLVQGTGGQALAATSSLGYGQTWQNVGASRAVNTTYYNTKGKPIQVALSGNVVNNTYSYTVNGLVVSYAYSGGAQGTGASVCFTVPPGGSYAASGFATWYELS